MQSIFMDFEYSTRNGAIYGNSKNKKLWIIYGSLMDIYDLKK